jgi:tetratricopeptide (TPR) repeat protein
MRLLGEEETRLTKRHTENLEAYNLYLQGRHLWNTRVRADLYKAVEYFGKALEKDASYALAYAGLADVYSILGNNQFLTPDESYPKAKEFARKALEIDPELAEAHSAVGLIERDYGWDFMGAKREFQRAIEINRGDANTHHQYAFLLSILGRHEDAIREIKLSRDLDPLASRIRANVGYVFYFARKYEEALEELDSSVEFDPTQCSNYIYLGFVYTAMGKHEEALRSQIKVLECQKGYRGKEYPGSATALMSLATAYACAGNTPEAQKLLEELKERQKKRICITFKICRCIHVAWRR